MNDLSPEQIKEADINNKIEDPQIVAVEELIAQAVQGFAFTMPISAAQQQTLERFGNAVGMSWEQYLKHQIETKILGDKLIGGALITGPSFAKGTTIKGPQR